MKRLLESIMLFLEQLGSGVWLGALAMFGVAVAATLFREQPNITLAGMLNAKILAKLNVLEAGCAVLMSISAVYFLVQPESRTWIRFVKAAMLAMMLVLLIYYGKVISDRMEELRAVIVDFDAMEASKQPLRDEFGGLHKLYTRLVSANLFLLLAYTALSVAERYTIFSADEKALS